MTSPIALDNIPTDEELDENEHLADSMALADEIEDEDVSFYANLCKDQELLDSFTRMYLIAHNDTTNSKSLEEVQLKNTIFNKKILADMAEREIKYEQQWKE